MPNEWNNLISIFTLFGKEQKRCVPSVEDLLSLLNLTKASDQGDGWFYVRARPRNKIVEDVLNKIEG